MSRVNPPPSLKIPEEIARNKKTSYFFEQIVFTLFQLWRRTGGGTDSVLATDKHESITQARVTDLELRIGSGDFVTGDTTGFTADTIKIYGDRVQT